MKPYLAVILDSFHEALVSKVLWILFIVTTVLLLVLAPLGVRRELHGSLNPDEVLDWPNLMSELSEGESDSASKGEQKMWRLLGGTLQGAIKETQKEVDPVAVSSQLRRDVLGRLNEMISSDDFYDEESWKGLRQTNESRALIDEDPATLSETRRARLNRLILDEALSKSIGRSRATSARMIYGFYEFSALNTDPQQVEQMIQLALAVLLDFVGGAFGIFVAIMVTASIIPNTLEAGSIDLLLSKPISRSLMFLAKYIGGCAFILLNLSYLIVGFYVILGFQYDMWNHRVLFCIPVLVFVFAIYYSVSCLGGLIWRSTVVCIIISILFWAACSGLSFVKGIFEGFAVAPFQLVTTVDLDDRTLAVTEPGLIKEWDADSNAWLDTGLVRQRGPAGGAPRRTYGPFLSKSENQVMYYQKMRQTFRIFSGELTFARHDETWETRAGPTIPNGLIEFLQDNKGDLLAVTRQNIMQLSDDDQFVEKGPDESLRLMVPAAAAIDAVTNEIAIWSKGEIIVLKKGQDGSYEVLGRKEFGSQAKAAVVAIGKGTIIVANDDGSVHVIDSATLELKKDLKPLDGVDPRFAMASSDGATLGILYHNKELWLYDQSVQEFSRPSIRGQGDITSAHLGTGTVAVVDRVNRLTEYTLSDLSVTRELSPDLSLTDQVYRYAIVPFYWLFPKPGELSNTATYLLTGKRTVAAGLFPADITAQRVEFDPWSPVWHGVFFTGIILLISCIYVSRKDF